MAEFLTREPIQYLEEIENELPNDGNLRPAVSALIEFLKRAETHADIYEPSRGLRATLFHELIFYISETFDAYFAFWILQIYLDRDGFGPLGGMIGDLNRQTLREEFALKVHQFHFFSARSNLISSYGI